MVDVSVNSTSEQEVVATKPRMSLAKRVLVGAATSLALGAFVIPAAQTQMAAPEASAACRATGYAWGWKPAWYGKAYNWYPVGSGCPYFNRGW